MKKKIHINQHKIKKNRSQGSSDPVISVKTYKSNTYGHEAIIKDANGTEVARIIYSPDKPLSCGAHVWISCDNEVDIIDKDGKLIATM